MIVTSSGYQFDIYSLIDYQNARQYRGSALGELADNKYLLNPILNTPFSARDTSHILNVTLKKRIAVKDLMTTAPQKLKSLLAQGIFGEHGLIKKADSRPSAEEIALADNLLGMSYHFEFLNKTVVHNFINFFTHPRAEECLQVFSRSNIYDLTGRHNDAIDFLSPECLEAVKNNLFNAADFSYIEDGQALLELIKPCCLAALRERRTSLALLKGLTGEELRTANRNNQYPALPNGLANVAEPLQTELWLAADKLQTLINAGVSLNHIVEMEVSRRESLLKNGTSVHELVAIGIPLVHFFEADIQTIKKITAGGRVCALEMIANDFNVPKEYFENSSLGKLLEIIDVFNESNERAVEMILESQPSVRVQP